MDNKKSEISTKKKVILTSLLLLCFIGIACLFLWSNNQEPQKQIAQHEQQKEKIDYLSKVHGLRNWKIAVNSKDVDFLEGVTWDKNYIKDVQVNHQKVDFHKVGNYQITYTILPIDKKASIIKINKNVTVTDKKNLISNNDNKQSKKLAKKKDKDSSAKKEDNKENNKPSSKPSNKPSNNNSSQKPSQPTKPHTHHWVHVSPEQSGHMEYGVECRSHGYSGSDPMFFMTQNDMLLHHMADGCNSSWGHGFKGLAYKYCNACGQEIITGHVHNFGTIEKTVYTKSIVCECGMKFSGGSGYTAKQNWEQHVAIYTSHGYPKEAHDTYREDTSSWANYYEATHACSCGWLPIDKNLVNLRNLRNNGYVEVSDVVVNGVHGQPL